MIDFAKVDELVASYETEWSTKDELEALCKAEGVLGWYMMYTTVATKVGLIEPQGYIA